MFHVTEKTSNAAKVFSTKVGTVVLSLRSGSTVVCKIRLPKKTHQKEVFSEKKLFSHNHFNMKMNDYRGIDKALACHQQHQWEKN